MIAICSNPNRGFRRLLASSDLDALSEVRGPMAIETVVKVSGGHEVPYTPKRHLSPEQIEEVVAGYLAGTTAQELGQKFEIDRTVVSRILRTNGVTMRLNSMQPAEIEQAIRLYESGLSLAKLAQIVPFDPSTIWREFRRLNVTMRDCHGGEPR